MSNKIQFLLLLLTTSQAAKILVDKPHEVPMNDRLGQVKTHEEDLRKLMQDAMDGDEIQFFWKIWTIN